MNRASALLRLRALIALKGKFLMPVSFPYPFPMPKRMSFNLIVFLWMFGLLSSDFVTSKHRGGLKRA